MNRNAVLLLLALAVIAGAAAFVLRGGVAPPLYDGGPAVEGASASPATVRPIGVMVNGPTLASNASSTGGMGGMEELAFYGTFARTRVALELSFPSGGVIDLVDDASSIQAFQDDRGTDLASEDGFGGPFEMMPRVAEDGRSMVFVAASDVLPAADAARLFLRGEIGFLVANERETHEAQAVALAPGTSFEVGPWTFEVTEAGASQWSEGWSVNLTTERDPAAIIAYSLVDAAGEVVELRPTMSMSGMGTWQQTLEAERALDRATFRIECWSDVRTERVPIDVACGLGLR